MKAISRVLATGLVLGAVFAGSSAWAAADVTDVRVGEHTGKTRIVLDMTGAPMFRYAVTPDRRQIVVDLPQSAWATSPARSLTYSKYVRGYRYADGRLVIETTTPVRILEARTLSPSGGAGNRLYFDVTDALPGTWSDMPTQPVQQAYQPPPPPVQQQPVQPLSEPEPLMAEPAPYEPPPYEPAEPQMAEAPEPQAESSYGQSDGMGVGRSYPRFYVGAGGGLSIADTGVSDLTGSTTLDEEDLGWKLFGGAEFNRYVGLEAFYADFGEAVLTGNTGDTFKYQGSAYAFTADNVKIVYGGSSLGTGVVLGYDVNDYVRPIGKLGVHRWEIASALTSSAGNLDASDSGFDIYGGLGLQINMTDMWSLRAEYERYSFGDENVDLISGSVLARF